MSVPPEYYLLAVVLACIIGGITAKLYKNYRKKKRNQREKPPEVFEMEKLMSVKSPRPSRRQANAATEETDIQLADEVPRRSSVGTDFTFDTLSEQKSATNSDYATALEDCRSASQIVLYKSRTADQGRLKEVVVHKPAVPSTPSPVILGYVGSSNIPIVDRRNRRRTVEEPPKALTPTPLSCCTNSICTYYTPSASSSSSNVVDYETGCSSVSVFLHDVMVHRADTSDEDQEFATPAALTPARSNISPDISSKILGFVNPIHDPILEYCTSSFRKNRRRAADEPPENTQNKETTENTSEEAGSNLQPWENMSEEECLLEAVRCMLGERGSNNGQNNELDQETLESNEKTAEDVDSDPRPWYDRSDPESLLDVVRCMLGEGDTGNGADQEAPDKPEE